MSIINVLKQRIFIRIYAGMMITCLCVGLFAQFLFNTINEHRAQSYREEVASGTFYVVAEGIANQQSAQQREYWISDASSLFGSQFNLTPINQLSFTKKEIERLQSDLSVVRYNKQQRLAHIYHKVPNEDNVLSVKITSVNEQQVRALAIFLLDDLSKYNNLKDRQRRLAELSNRFPFTLQYRDIDSLNLDDEQISRLRSDKVVMLFRDGSTDSRTSIVAVVPSEVKNLVIEMGPLPLFNTFPINVVLLIALIGLALITFGIYLLIRPLQHKLKQLQLSLNAVSQGKLDTRMIVTGEDETAVLSATFNAMATHIKRLIESQRELTRAVSHELRTPVARIRFAVDMIADTDDVESRHLQRDFIDKDIEELNGLIDEILTYAKLEEGSPKMEWANVNLKELVEQIIRETNALGKPIEVIGNYQKPRIYSEAYAEADERYLHRVVQNLVGNALRYANNKIIINAGVIKGKGLAFVSVEDDGHGIPKSDRDKVFIPFARLDDSRTRASGGYGLGLSIVSRICFWFNGEMSVDESPELGGARFTMTWPIKQLTQAIIADEITQEHNERKIIDA